MKRYTYYLLVIYSDKEKVNNTFCAYSNNYYVYNHYMKFFKLLFDESIYEEFVYDNMTEDEFVSMISNDPFGLSEENEISSTSNLFCSSNLYFTDSFITDITLNMYDCCGYNCDPCGMWFVRSIMETYALLRNITQYLNSSNEFITMLIKFIISIVKRYISTVFLFTNEIEELDSLNLTVEQTESWNSIIKFDKSINNLELYDIIDEYYMALYYSYYYYGYPKLQ